MNLAMRAELRHVFAAEALSQVRRALRLKVGRNNLAGAGLLVQRINVREALNDGIPARIICLSARANLPLKTLIGQPAEFQIVTDQGDIRSICAIVTRAKVGQSDGSLAVCEVEAQDAGEEFIVEQSLSLHHVMSPEFSVGGAGGVNPSVNVPTNKTSFNQQAVMRWQGSYEPMKNHRYRIAAEDGRVIEGRTDAQGRTERFDGGIAYGRYTIEPLDD